MKTPEGREPAEKVNETKTRRYAETAKSFSYSKNFNGSGTFYIGSNPRPMMQTRFSLSNRSVKLLAMNGEEILQIKPERLEEYPHGYGIYNDEALIGYIGIDSRTLVYANTIKFFNNKQELVGNFSVGSFRWFDEFSLHYTNGELAYTFTNNRIVFGKADLMTRMQAPALVTLFQFTIFHEINNEFAAITDYSSDWRTNF